MQKFRSIPQFLQAIGIQPFHAVNNFYICRLEDYFGHKPFEFPPYHHDFFELIFSRGHDVDVKIGSSAFNETDNVVSFNTPYQVSSWKVNAFEPDSIGYMILFKPEFVRPSFDKLDLYQQFAFLNAHTLPVLALSPLQSEVIITLMQTMSKEFGEKSDGRQSVILGAYLTILLEKVNAMFMGTTSRKVFANRAEEITFLFENLLKQEVSYKFRLSDYAAKLNISSTYLSEVVKKTTGKAAKTLMQEYVIYEAKTLLRQSNATVAAVADELGFSDATNFVKYFKHKAGMTPNAFRKQA